MCLSGVAKSFVRVVCGGHFMVWTSEFFLSELSVDKLIFDTEGFGAKLL